MPVIRESLTKLRAGGYLALSIGKDSRGRKISEDVANLLSYEAECEFIEEMLMQTGVSEYGRKSGAKKFESIMVFRKR